MYFSKIEIKHFRQLINVKMNFEAGSEMGWHVVLGDNGSGKTTFLRAIALCLLRNEEIAQEEVKSLMLTENGTKIIAT